MVCSMDCYRLTAHFLQSLKFAFHFQTACDRWFLDHTKSTFSHVIYMRIANNRMFLNVWYFVDATQRFYLASFIQMQWDLRKSLFFMCYEPLKMMMQNRRLHFYSLLVSLAPRFIWINYEAISKSVVLLLRWNSSNFVTRIDLAFD